MAASEARLEQALNGNRLRMATSSGELRGLHQGSARALLLVILGEYVWPSGEPVWSSTLLRALAELDVEPMAARKAIQRTAEQGVIEPIRKGREAQWTLSAEAHHLFEAGFDRVFGWAQRDRAWDGRWLMVSVRVPETQRRTRHHLQSQLEWLGLGSPAPGEWLTPHVHRSDEVARVVRSLELEDLAYWLVGSLGGPSSPQDVVHRAWDLAAIEGAYRDFLTSYDVPVSRTDRDSFRQRLDLVQAWRRFPYLDPDLPAQYLPRIWVGDRAARLFTRRHAALGTRAWRRWKQLSSTAD